jgi:hypothetical protein
MRRYAYSETGQFYEQYELTLADDGTFEWNIGYSDPAGSAGGSEASGRWRQQGNTITFEVLERSDASVVPTTATVRGDDLEVSGIGTFWTSKR